MLSPPAGAATAGPIRIGISSCLLGEPVRYDGNHRLDHYVRDTLGPFVDWVPVCPEVECGLGVPREAMRLVGDPAAPRLVTRGSGVDHTDRLLDWAGGRLERLAADGVRGFVFKSKSPSCAVTGGGLFARAFAGRFPDLPITDEVRLRDPQVVRDFLERAG